MRKMATIRQIDEIRPIPGADSIECAVVGGWTVVVKKGDYKSGDLAVYCEIDSWIPTEVAPFLTKVGQEPKEYKCIKGERLRTVKLRGQLSQGLLLPMSTFFNFYSHDNNWYYGENVDYISIDQDVSELLGIVKYEAPIPAQLAGEVKGAFPNIIPKTDQERIQNLTSEFDVWKAQNELWEVTEKLDGSSMTVYKIQGEFGVCSRNLDLKRNYNNSFWKAVQTQALEEILNNYDNIAFQGELVGEGIQKNLYKKKGQHFFLFDIYLINEGRYTTPKERHEFIKTYGISHVPIIDRGGIIMHNVDHLLSQSEGKSLLNEKTEREGLVFKRHDGKASFKAISNRFLLKNDG